ncbi:MAG: TM2 domain-containing protein [Limosilactobacillus sp.]|uniref:TM2 domain-containing protein n=1 Tax=Limosilactobacillus sp. TaxID=2773925 RepID=UPI0026F52FF7|nr:TM2 domain-containing protein [Limosilactobacillus sp.]
MDFARKHLMTDRELISFESEVNRRSKNVVVAYLLAIFLGSIGAHRYYLKKIGTGIVMTLLAVFGWMLFVSILGMEIAILLFFIDGIWVIVDLFLIPSIVNKDRTNVENEVFAQIMAERSMANQAQPAQNADDAQQTQATTNTESENK